MNNDNSNRLSFSQNLGVLAAGYPHTFVIDKGIKHLGKGLYTNSKTPTNLEGFNYLKKRISDDKISLLIKGTKEYKEVEKSIEESALPTYLKNKKQLVDRYIPTKKMIVSTSKKGDNLHALAHEYGHSKSYKNFPNLYNVVRSGKVLISGASIAPFFMNDYLNKTKKQKEKTPFYKNPYITLPAIAAAGAFPTLYDEYKASKIGMETLKLSKSLNLKDLKIAKKALTHAYGTYALQALAAVASPLVTLRARQYFLDKNKNKLKTQPAVPKIMN